MRSVRDPILTPTDQDWAWIAGFIEGDGSFVRLRNSKTKRFSPPPVGVMIAVQQVNYWPLERLQDLLGGGLYEATHRPSGANKVKGTWQLYGQRAMDAMERIYPMMSPRRQMQILTVLDREHLITTEQREWFDARAPGHTLDPTGPKRGGRPRTVPHPARPPL